MLEDGTGIRARRRVEHVRGRGDEPAMRTKTVSRHRTDLESRTEPEDRICLENRTGT